jgi:hypothetical protein
MSRTRIAFFVVLCAASCVWASLVFLGLSVRFAHQGMVDTIREGGVVKDKKALARAVADYENAITTLPCNTALLTDLSLLRAYGADGAMESPDESNEAEALEAMRAALLAQLSCSPRDGKVWLDLAAIDTFREGFTASARNAYGMSANVAPAESWLAEKRLQFALKFQPMWDDRMRKVGLADLSVLERAHPNRMTAVLGDAQIESPDALYALYGATRPSAD